MLYFIVVFDVCIYLEVPSQQEVLSMFIVVEGVDGTGKSTLCKILANKIGAIAYSTPPERYRALREGIDRDASPEEHYKFYLEGLYEASTEIERILNSGQKVVFDRYWLSTFTSHRAMGVQVSEDDFKRIVMPDLTVILSLNKHTQIIRMLDRGLSIGDKRALHQQQELAVAFYLNILESKQPFMVLDTGQFSSETCAEIVTTVLNCQ